jgi:hypothetical protein
VCARDRRDRQSRSRRQVTLADVLSKIPGLRQLALALAGVGAPVTPGPRGEGEHRRARRRAESVLCGGSRRVCGQAKDGCRPPGNVAPPREQKDASGGGSGSRGANRGNTPTCLSVAATRRCDAPAARGPRRVAGSRSAARDRAKPWFAWILVRPRQEPTRRGNLFAAAG